MALTFEQLTAPRTPAEIRAQLLQALQGIGFVAHRGTGIGGVDAAGVATGSFAVVLEIVTGGELGEAQFKTSLDGGKSWSAPSIVPGGAVYVLGTTGATLTFFPGPPGAGTSFVAGDTYRFSMAAPTLPVTSWQPGSTPRTLVENDAVALADLDELVAKIAAGGLVETASGPWLDLLAANVYDVARKAAIQARGVVVLADTANAGPFAITPGQLWVATADGRRYTNVAAGTIPLGGTVALVFGAESPGAAYNVGNGTIAALLTPLPGVTVSNPDPGSGSWLTQTGADEEPDEALRDRCKARWAQLGTAATAEGYEGWALDATEEVTRVLVRESPTIPGQVDVYVAGPSGAPSPGAVAAVDAYIQPRVPLTSTANVQAVTNVAVTVTATVYVRAAFRAIAEAAAAANLQRLFSELEIGGTLYRAQLIEELMTPPGVVNVVLTLPAGDVTLGATQVATLTQSLTWVEV